MPDPQQEPHLEFSRFEDGTIIMYDRKKHKLYADVKGDIEIKATGNANMTVQKNVSLTVQGSISIDAQKSITLKSGVSVELNAPLIKLGGILSVTGADGSAGSGTLSGTYTIKEGSLHVPDSDVTAGSVSLRGHVHDGIYPGPDSTKKPVGG